MLSRVCLWTVPASNSVYIHPLLTYSCIKARRPGHSHESGLLYTCTSWFRVKAPTDAAATKSDSHQISQLCVQATGRTTVQNNSCCASVHRLLYYLRTRRQRRQTSRLRIAGGRERKTLQGCETLKRRPSLNSTMKQAAASETDAQRLWSWVLFIHTAPTCCTLSTAGSSSGLVVALWL